MRPDVAIVHAQKADRDGNVLIEGIVGVQKEAVLAAARAVVTVEEIVDRFEGVGTNAVILPSWTLDAIVEVPGGAHPSYAHGYYERDNAFYVALGRDRARSRALHARGSTQRHVHGPGDFAARAASNGAHVMSAAYTPSEMMTVAAARALTNDDICFVGIGLPSAACNLARLTHAPKLTLVYESGHDRDETDGAAAVDRRRRALRDGADDGVGAGDVPGTGCRADGSRSASSAARRSIASAT